MLHYFWPRFPQELPASVQALLFQPLCISSLVSGFAAADALLATHLADLDACPSQLQERFPSVWQTGLLLFKKKKKKKRLMKISIVLIQVLCTIKIVYNQSLDNSVFTYSSPGPYYKNVPKTGSFTRHVLK